MKRAFLFSILFVLIFTTLILLSVFYLRMMQMNELNLVQSKNISRVLYVRDDVANDILDYLQLSASIQSNSTNTILSISDTLPSPYSNPSAALAAYKTFINGTYSNQTNLIDPATNLSLISLNTTAFESAPSLQFLSSNSSLSLNYSYTNLSKNELIINGSSLVTSYYITVALNDTCFNNNCAGAMLAGGPPTNGSSTVALWHFDEGSGTTVYDSSGNGNTGTLENSPTWVGGRFGGGIRFAGLQYVPVTDSSSLDVVGNHTIEVWFNATSTGSYNTLISKANSSNLYNTTDYSIIIDNPTKIVARVANGTNYQSILSTQPVQLNTWYHVAFIVNGTNLILYVNGVLDNITSQTITPLPNTNNLTIGAIYKAGGAYFYGTIDEVAIYSRAKSADEIASDANLFHWDWSPIAMNSNLSAAWHFDENTGNTTYDASGNGNTISMNGTQLVVLKPSTSQNKAYGVNSTNADNPLLATTELNYPNIVTSGDGNWEFTLADYESGIIYVACQPAGTCHCTNNDTTVCWYPDTCTDETTHCTAGCPSTPPNTAQTASSCSSSANINGCYAACTSTPCRA